MAKKKSTIEKVTEQIVEAVDHLMHPDQAAPKDDAQEKEISPVEKNSIESETKNSDYESHPKFSKFKK